MKLKLFFLLLLTLLIVNSSLLITHATVRYVSKTGTSTPPYISWQTAADSIQKCINICVDGDTVYVANGVYYEQVIMIPGLSLIGAGMDSCIINFPFTGIPAVQIVDSCLLAGFKIIVPNTLNTWGIESIGYGSLIVLNNIVNASLGIYVDDSNVTIYKNKFENIKTRGVWIFNSNSIIRQNLIYTDPNSQSGSPTGIRIEAFNNNYTPIIDSNYIETIARGIDKSFGTRPIIKNNTIVFRNAPWGIFLSISDSAVVNNNLIISDMSGTAIINNGTSFAHICNNYVTGSFYDSGIYWAIALGSNDFVKNNVVTNALRGVEAGGNQNLIFGYNDVWNTVTKYSGFVPDTTNLSVDPMVINDDSTQGELDFHLQKYSPLIDAGDPEMFDNDSSRMDIGLYGGLYGEGYKYYDLAPRPPRNLSALVDTNQILLKWNKNTEADTAYYKVYRDTTVNFIIDSTKLISSQLDTFFVQLPPYFRSKYVYKITCIDKQGNESNSSEEVVIDITSVSIDDYPMTINDYLLYQNYPNPFNPSTKISYKLKERGYVKLYVYDIKGELISVMVNKEQNVGFYEVEFSASRIQNPESSIKELASGVYIYQLIVIGENNIPIYSDIKKMIYLK